MLHIVTPSLLGFLVLILCGFHVVRTDQYPYEEEDHVYGIHHDAADYSFPQLQSIPSEPVTSLPLIERLEDVFLENYANSFHEHLLTVDELMEGGREDGLPPSLQFTDVKGIMPLLDTTMVVTADSQFKTEVPDDIIDSYLLSDHDEPVKLVISDDFDNSLFAAEELIKRNVRGGNHKVANKRQAAPGEQRSILQKSLFLLPSNFQQHLAILIPGQPGQPTFLVPLDKSFTQLLSRSTIAVDKIPLFMSTAVQHGIFPRPQQNVQMESDQIQREQLRNSKSLNVNIPDHGFSADVTSKAPEQSNQFVDKTRPKVVTGNVVSMNEQPPVMENPINRAEVSIDDHAASEGDDENQHFHPFEEIRFAPLDSSPSATELPMRSPLHDQLLHAKVVVSPPNKREGMQRPIITAIPSVVASSPRFHHQSSAGHSSTPTPTSSPSVQASLVSNDISMEDASGAFDHHVEFAQEEHVSHNIDQIQEEEQEVGRLFSRSITELPIATSEDSLSNEVPILATLGTSPKLSGPLHIKSEISQQGQFSQEGVWQSRAIEQPDLRNFAVHVSPGILSSSQHERTPEKHPSMHTAEPTLDSSHLGIAERHQQNQLNILRTKPLPSRLARQDSPMESQREMQQARADIDAHRGIRMPRTKSPPSWPKPGQASGSFSGTQGKLPLIQRPNGQASSSRTSTRTRPKHSTLMMALLRKLLLHPVPSAAPPQQVPPDRPQPFLPAQQEESDKVFAATESAAQQERSQRPVPWQDRQQEADGVVSQTVARQQEDDHDSRGKGKKENLGLQNPEPFLSQQSGSSFQTSQTNQRNKGRQGLKTPVMQSTSSSVASPQDQIPTVVIRNRLPQPNRAPLAGFRRLPSDSVSLLNGETTTRSKRSVPATEATRKREEHSIFTRQDPS